MEQNKIYSYDAGTINVPKMINEVLNKEYANQEHEYLFFIQNDVLELAINKDEIIEKYIEHMKDWDIPYVMYAFYGRFNSVLPEHGNVPNPNFIFKYKDKICCGCRQLAYGFLGLDITKLKNKKILFNENFPEIFYLQDFVEQCYRERMWISNYLYLDINESWKFFKEHKNNGYNLDFDKFKKERDIYNSVQRIYEPVENVIEKLRLKLTSPEIFNSVTQNNKDLTITVDNSSFMPNLNVLNGENNK